MDEHGWVGRLAARRLRVRERARPPAAADDVARPAVTACPEALDLAAEVGAVLLSNGAAASEIVDLVLDICMVAGLADVSVVVTYDQVIVSLEGEETFATVHSRVAPVRTRTYNFGTYTATVELAQQYLTRQISEEQALTQLRVPGRGRIWPRWVTTLAAGVTGFSAGIIFGAAPTAALLASVAVMFSDLMFRSLARRRWPGFFIQMLVGAIAVLVASGGLLVVPGMNAYAVVVAVIIVALAGMTVTGAVQDAVTGWYLTGSVRVFEAVVKTVGLLVGIKAMAALIDIVNAPSVDPVVATPGALPPVATAAATATMVLAFAVMAQTPFRGVVTAAVIGVAGHLVHTLVSSGDVGAVWPAAIAAVVIGILGALAAPWVHIPFSALTSGAVLPLLPGLALLQGLMDTTMQTGVGALSTALGIAVGLATGVTLGGHLVTVVTGPWRTQDDRIYTPHFSEPVATLRERNALDHSPRVFTPRRARSSSGRGESSTGR